MIRAYSVEELLLVEDPEWLIEGVLPLNALAALFGQPGDGKSFIALDAFFSVAAGVPWQGHNVPRKGYGIYVSAEGSGGLKKRAAAWLSHHGFKGQELRDIAAHFLLSAIAITPDSEELVTLLEQSIHPARVESFVDDGLDPNEDMAPLFIVVDTLARCFVGDENQQEDMGNFIKGLDTLRERYNATILVLHHSGKGAYSEPRGSSSFKGACDVMMQVTKKGMEIALACTKQKDYEEFETKALALQVDEQLDTCVVVGSDFANEEQALKDMMLAKLQRVQPATWNEWLADLPLEGKAHRLVQLLLKDGRLAKVDKKWTVAEEAL